MSDSNFEEQDYNGNRRDRGHYVPVDPSQDFMNFLVGSPEQRGGLVEDFFSAVFNEQDGEVNHMVRKLVSREPQLDTPLGRFNAGQAMAIKLTALLHQLLDNRLADYINYATIEFVSSTTSREAKETSTKRVKPQAMGGIG